MAIWPGDSALLGAMISVAQRGVIHSRTPVGRDLVKLRGSILKSYQVLIEDGLGHRLPGAGRRGLDLFL